MSRTVGIGIQDFAKLIEGKYFYIDKTSFIKEWWESGDDVTIITRPRRFGKTLNMNMINRFFLLSMQGRESYLKDFQFGMKTHIENFRGRIL